MLNGVSANNMSLKDAKASNSNVKVILGGQWGDEGKGKIVDLLAENMDMVCRGQVCWLLGRMYFSRSPDRHVSDLVSMSTTV